MTSDKGKDGRLKIKIHPRSGGEEPSQRYKFIHFVAAHFSYHKAQARTYNLGLKHFLPFIQSQTILSKATLHFNS